MTPPPDVAYLRFKRSRTWHIIDEWAVVDRRRVPLTVCHLAPPGDRQSPDTGHQPEWTVTHGQPGYQGGRQICAQCAIRSASRARA